MDFEKIILQQEQKDFFVQLVETIKAIPYSKREPIYTSSDFDGKKLIISTKDHQRHDIENIVDGDMEILSQKGLLNGTPISDGEMKYKITPEGFEYYSWLMKEQAKSVERVEKSIVKYLEVEDFKNNYHQAYKKLKKAEEMLWSSDSEQNFTTIGHLCRESMQEFADQLYYNTFDKKSSEKKSKTLNRIRSVIEQKKSTVGSTIEDFLLKGLYPYWKMIDQIVQRQEHGAQKEKGEDIDWEDSRRVVFQTTNAMFEIHRSLK